MKITSFSVKNFKGIGEDGVKIDILPITLLFGANNSGKSSIIQALFLAREVICNKNLNPDTVQGGGDLIKLGGFCNFVNNHDLNKSVILKFDISIDDPYDLFTKKYFNKSWELAFININKHKKPDIIDFYTKNIIQDTICNINNLSYEIFLSWDHANSNVYISKRRTYINGSLVVDVQTMDDKTTTFINGLENDIFSNLYEPETIISNEEYIEQCNQHKNEKDYDNFCKSLHLVMENQYDYQAFDNGLGLVSQGTSKSAYHTVRDILLLKLLNRNIIINIIKRLNNTDSNIKKWFYIASLCDGAKETCSNLEIDKSNIIDFIFSKNNILTMMKIKLYQIFKIKKNNKFDRLHIFLKYMASEITLWSLIVLFIYSFMTKKIKSDNKSMPKGVDYQFKYLINCDVLKNQDSNVYNDEFFRELEGKIRKNIVIKYESEDCEFDAKQFRSATSNGEHLIYIHKFLDTIIFDPLRILNNNLKQMLYIGTQRITIERRFNPETIQALTWADGMAAWQELVDNVELVNQVNSNINKVLGDEFDLRLVHLKDVSIDVNRMTENINILYKNNKFITSDQLINLISSSGTDIHNRIFFIDKSGVYLSPNDLGHGVSQIIPILVAPLLSRNNANIVAIEEPESNIHPAWQVELAEFFLRIASRHKQNNTVENNSDKNPNNTKMKKNAPPFILLETHSEHIMLRILRRIRETYENELPEGAQDAYPEDIAVYYVQKNNKLKTQEIRMEITPDGDFNKRWPKGFFEERAEELF